MQAMHQPINRCAAFSAAGAFLAGGHQLGMHSFLTSSNANLCSCVSWPAGEQPFKLLGRVMKAHTRVIWACSWAPGDASFATGARDSVVKLWALGSSAEGALSTCTLVQRSWLLFILETHESVV